MNDNDKSQLQQEALEAYRNRGWVTKATRVCPVNELGLEELKAIRRELYGAESTDENLAKVRAIEAQIGRREEVENDAWRDFEVGDVVSRMGDDEQEIVGRNDLGDLIEVRCIKPDAHGVFKTGDTEWNIPWRYELRRREKEDHEKKNDAISG